MQKKSRSKSSKVSRVAKTRRIDSPFRLMDLFSGCGGMTLGFAWDHLFNRDETNPILRNVPRPTKAGFRPVFANDNDVEALNTYKANFRHADSHCVDGRIEDVLKGSKSIPQADVLIGGPPCQGFSLLNRNRNG